MLTISSELSVAGSEESNIPFTLYNPLSLRQLVTLGSSLSVYGLSRFGSTLSVLDFVTLGSALSVRSFSRLGSAISVLDFAFLGSSLSVRSFARIGSSLSVLGMTRLGASLSIFDSATLAPGKVVDFPGGWVISWESVGETMAFTKDAGSPSFTITPTGGSLHGTWSAESIISASDRRLKRLVRPLERSLHSRGRRLGVVGIGGGGEEDEADAPSPPLVSTASSLLASLRPRILQLSRAGKGAGAEAFGDGSDGVAQQASAGFDADLMAKVFPDLVRQVPPGASGARASAGGARAAGAGAGAAGAGGAGRDEGTKIVYQDLIAVLTLAAKERQSQIERLEALEAQEDAEIERQEALLEAVEASIATMGKRFSRLRRLRPTSW